MADWKASMIQTYEYYVVDPNTWKDIKKLDNVKTCTISRDYEAETLGSATIDVTDIVDECYIRIYLITIQDEIREKHPLGTFLVQTPSTSFDGRTKNASLDAYTPLMELKENPPPIGYSLLKGENVMDAAYRIIRENARAPVVKTECSETLTYDFIAETNDTWLSFVSDLIANAKYELDLDEMGRILFTPKQDTASLQPVWEYDDTNSSILYPEISLSNDMFGIPNVVEVIYSNGGDHYHAKVVNDDSNSPISTVSRGRAITYRDTNPNLVGIPTEKQIQEYANQLLRELSSLEKTVSYSHGYCPVRIRDCVRLKYTRAEINDIKAKVVSQSIKCESGCPVTEKAVFTSKLWG